MTGVGWDHSQWGQWIANNQGVTVNQILDFMVKMKANNGF